jgi:glycogen debranching enzyme
MSSKITVGPPVLTINKGSTFMVTDRDGEIDPRAPQGVFAEDTRFLSGYRLWIDGARWQRVTSATVTYYAARLHLTNPLLHSFDEMREIPADTLALKWLRAVDEGVNETFEITNFGVEPVHAVFEIELKSDFADLFEVKSGPLRQRENLVTQWDPRRAALVTSYRNRDFFRCFTYQVVDLDKPPTYANGRLLFPIRLEPGATWRASGQMLLQCGGHLRKPRQLSAHTASRDRADQLHQRWLDRCTKLETPNEDVRHAYAQSVEDMGALRLFEQDLGPDLWVPAAGVPWFVTLFGRDSLIVSLQCLMVHARFAEGALRTLATYQAAARDDWRDAQPGKIVHEIRSGELAHFNLVPHTRYYGTWDATPLFLVTLAEAWRWLGDRQLIEDLCPAAERCLEWIDRYGDLDGDGFQEYRTYSKQGYENMGWKDAHDAVVYPDGSQVSQPKALCELQGNVYAAKLGMAEVFAALGNRTRADQLAAEAAELKRRFNATFWLEDESIYAFGLDPEKKAIATVASNAGQCLWAGIADPDKARRSAYRLLQPDMWSGWGIRTLSSRNPAYDPFLYQRGSVWPHDNALIASGMKRYGLVDPANRVARAIFEAATYFQSYRLPELFAGLEREPDAFPVEYRGANIPQAWAAGSIFQVLQMMLGLRADAPNDRLYVDPTLPDWLPALAVSDLEVGRTHLDLRFWREGDATLFAVERQRGTKIAVLAEGKGR